VEPQDVLQRLSLFLRRWYGGEAEVQALHLLAGGGHHQTWAFDAQIRDEDGTIRVLPLVYRSDAALLEVGFIPREREYKVLRAAYLESVPVPRVHPLVDEPSRASQVEMLVMDRVEGETVARRILREEAYAGARRRMTAQMGAILARIHSIPVERHGLGELSAPPPGRSPAEHEVDRWEGYYRSVVVNPQPVYELAFRWLRRNLPKESPCTLVHGDFRLGNLIVGPKGVRAVIDWDQAHIGDPMEDLGWVCVRSWRFGNDHLLVGGLGTQQEFRRAYEGAGDFRVDEERWRFWEVFGNLRWGIFCVWQAHRSLYGGEPNIDYAMTGRRAVETQWEILRLVEG
jgi:aminoglycoside phosphotransferase (APT) family kinase protein